ncbi:MAG: hypothetical protein ACREYF_07720 [Gammaproteobacteria bacterium]
MNDEPGGWSEADDGPPPGAPRIPARWTFSAKPGVGNGKTKNSFPTRIDLGAEVRGSMIALLNQHLADAFDLSSQTKQADCGITH